MFNRRWSTVVHQACRSPNLAANRCLCGRTPYIRAVPTVYTSPRRVGSRIELSSPRTFSTSVARRKEKPPPKAGEDGQEDEQRKSTEVKESSPKGEEDVASAKSRGSGPAPIPPPDGKGAAAGGESGGASGGEGGGKGKKKSEKSLTKPQVPDVYPQVMAIPIAQRPLFPGFYKAITIRDPNVIGAVNELIKRGQSYVGAFLLKDPHSTKDVIDDPSEVYDVGTFCQITGAFSAGHGDDVALQAVLYPHRRIKLTELIPPDRTATQGSSPTEKVATATITAEPTDAAPPKKATNTSNTPPATTTDKQGDVVASFEEQAAEAQAQRKQEQQKQVSQYEPTSFLRSWGVSLVNTENLVDEPFDKASPHVRAYVSEIVNICKEIASVNQLFRDHVSAFATAHTATNIADEPAKLADFAAAIAGGGEMEEAQGVLASLNIEERLRLALTVIKREQMNAELTTKISKDVENKIQKRQREYWLLEQMKGIKRELGLESDGKDKMVEKFKERASKLAMPEAVRKVFDEELNKLAHLEPAASEFNVTRNYLDWLTQIPWGQRSAETFGIKNAMTVLDEDHYGLKDVKDRILEFIAVGKLRGTVEGKILCMVGPPGVGKTSIGKSIARALNRQYYRFSVGGLTDVAEIKGHRRTYVGALPGRIIQALKKCQTENPLVLIDEVDKIGRGHQGDPSSALLELLDPEQNSSFLDHYMDVPVDLSKVLFVCTANMTDTIPRPLLDRMEMIELSGYVADEKMAIAEKYLAPAAKELSGLKGVDVSLEKEAIAELINKYCRESGVRNLKKQIEKVYRKSALKIVQDVGEEVLSEDKALTEEGKAAQEAAAEDGTEVKDTPSEEKMEAETTEKPRVALKVPDSVHVSINKDNLKDYVGPPIFTADRLYEITPAGVAMGLAWTQMGGAALYVESILESALTYNSRPGLERTGNLRPVMKESTQIAYSFAKSLLAKNYPKNKFFDKARIHLHCPEGAVQKDGPSAGITMATSLLSLALDKPINATIAMTGELTVTGKVLRIGGLREKTVAAKRAGAEMVIFPKDNTSDWLELPQNIKEGIEGKPVEWYSEVFELMFPGLDRAEAEAVWKMQLQKPPKEERDDNEDGESNFTGQDMASMIKDQVTSVFSSTSSTDKANTDSDGEDKTNKFRLRVTAGPTYDKSLQRLVKVNSPEAHVVSENVAVSLRIRDYGGLPSSSPATVPEYFDLAQHSKDTFSVAWAFTPSEDMPSSNLYFGIDTGHNPIRKFGIPKSLVNTAFKIVKEFIDPSLSCDAGADEPWVRGPAVAGATTTLCVGEGRKMSDGEEVPPSASGGVGVQTSPRPPPDLDASRRPSSSSAAGSPSRPSPLSPSRNPSVSEPQDLSHLSFPDPQLLVEGAVSPEAQSYRKRIGLDPDASRRRKHLSSESNRKSFVLERGRPYYFDFSNGYIDWAAYALKLPGFSVPVLKFIGGGGKPSAPAAAPASSVSSPGTTPSSSPLIGQEGFQAEEKEGPGKGNNDDARRETDEKELGKKSASHKVRFFLKDIVTEQVYFVIMCTLLTGEDLRAALEEDQREGAA